MLDPASLLPDPRNLRGDWKKKLRDVVVSEGISIYVNFS